MPNKNYIKGRAKEYRIAKSLKAQGFEICQRTAGSHSPIDIIAINPTAKIIRLVQSKPDSMSERQKEKIEKENKNLNGWFDVKFKVI